MSTTTENKKEIACFALGCETSETNNPCKLVFYPITSDLKEQWCEVLGRDSKKCEEEYVCSKHFRQTDFFFGKMTKRMYLKPNVTPSLNLGTVTTTKSLKINKMLTCYVLGCDTTETNNPDKLDFYKINPTYKEKWCAALGRDPTTCKEEFICSKHFKESDFYYGKIAKRLILKHGAVPSQNLEYMKTEDNKYVSMNIKVGKNETKRIMLTSGVAIDLTEPPPLKMFKFDNTITDTSDTTVDYVQQTEENQCVTKEITVNNTKDKIDANKSISLPETILKKKENLKIVKVEKLDKCYERQPGVIRIFNASDVASDVETSNTESTSVSEDSDCDVDPTNLDHSYSVRTVTTSKIKDNPYLKNADAILVTSKNAEKKSAKNNDLPYEILSKRTPESIELVKIISENLDPDERYILIKPDLKYNVTEKKITACTQILSSDDWLVKCKNCEKDKQANSIRHDHFYGDKDDRQCQAYKNKIAKQRRFIAELKRHIKKLHTKMDDLDSVINEQNKLLDIL